MKRLHVHVAVEDLEGSIGFYSALFGAEPSVTKPDYAKWMLDDPRVNFAISARGRRKGLDHLGIQVDSADELDEVTARLSAADQSIFAQEQANCCYAVGDKAWVTDPQGIAWESFHTLEDIPLYGTDFVPDAVRGSSEPLPAEEKEQASESKTGCCS